MNGRVLVAYGSRMGSTAEIATAVAIGLRTQGLDVTIGAAKEVQSLEPYDVVVLGSAIYAGRWCRDALRLLRRERRVLSTRRVWLFQSGLSVTGPHPTVDPTPASVAKLAREIGSDLPMSFGGCLTAETAHGLLPRLMVRFGKAGGDHRDWDRIRDWSLQIAAEICAGTQEIPSAESTTP